MIDWREAGGWLGRVAYLVIVASVIISGILLAVHVERARAQHSNPWLLEWIPARCCVTNDCCWEVQANDLRSLPDDHWEVRATGQVLKRTDWSPDGRYYRCACDLVEGKWVRHDKAKTNCVFAPMPMG